MLEEWIRCLHGEGSLTSALARLDDLVRDARSEDAPVTTDLLVSLVAVERELRAIQSSLAETWARVSDLSDQCIEQVVDEQLIR